MKKLLVILLSIVLFCGCAPEKQQEKAVIYATLFPQYDFCRQIAGDKAQVELLLPFGMESHNYEPGVYDIKNISDADMFVYTGAFMEPWAEEIIKTIKTDVFVLDASLGVELFEENHQHHESDGHQGHYDPHIWTSPKNALIMAQNILDALCMLDSKNSAYYIHNANELFNDLKRLDSEFQELSVKTKDKVLCHGGKFSLNYLTGHYGIKFLPAFDSCSSWAEPSVTRINDIILSIKSQNLKAVFYEELTTGKIADVIKEETGAEKLLLHSCHNVSLKEYQNGATYISLMEQNVINIKKAIGEF